MADLGVGTVYAGHRVEALLGRGELGAVYRATHVRLRQRRALRMVAAPDADAVERIRANGSKLVFEHPHAVQTFDVGVAEARPYVSMALVEGATDLRELLSRRERLPVELAARVVEQVASALDAAWARGLVHGDLKPANVFLTGEPDAPVALVADTGLALLAGGGSADYAAPERIEGRALDARADVYSLGCVLFHALTGGVPYPRDTKFAVAHAHLHEPPPPMPGVQPALARVVERALAKQEAARFASAGELARELSAAAGIASGASLAAGATVAGTPVVEPPRPTETRTIAGEPPPLPERPTIGGGVVQPPLPERPTIAGPPPPLPERPTIAGRPPPLPPGSGPPDPPPPPPPERAGGLRSPQVFVPLAALAVALIVVVVLAATGAFSGDEKKSVAKRATPTAKTTATTPPPPPGAAAHDPGESLTIYSSLPEQGASGSQAKALEDGARLAIDDARAHVGDFVIRYKALDDSLASTGSADEGKAAQNARQAASDDTTIGYIGEYNSGISKVSIPLLNMAGIAQVSPSNTYVGLTQSGTAAEPGEPDKYYPAGTRTYARIVPNDSVQGAALAAAAEGAGCRSIEIWNSGTTYAAGLADFVSEEARKIGLDVRGNEVVDPTAPNYRSRARSITGDCFIWTGEVESNGTQVLKDAARAPSVKRLFSGDGNCLNTVKELPAAVQKRFKCTIASLDPSAYGVRGTKFFRHFKSVYVEKHPDPYAIYGYESMSLLLDAISRASQRGTAPVTRAQVVKALFETSERDGVIGTYSIDEKGDTTLREYGLYGVDKVGLYFDSVLKP